MPLTVPFYQWFTFIKVYKDKEDILLLDFKENVELWESKIICELSTLFHSLVREYHSSNVAWND